MSTMDLEIAAGYGECSVCFEPLCMKGSSIMTDGTGQAASYFPTRPEILPRRICRHFLCQECAPTIVNHKCPVCRRDFIDTFDVPDPLEDPVRWFHVVDVDQSGTIEKSELVDALRVCFDRSRRPGEGNQRELEHLGRGRKRDAGRQRIPQPSGSVSRGDDG
ncbi:unnamed protein product [Ascophyllum nodosum]